MFCIYRIDQLAFERRWCVLSESDFLGHFFFQFTNISCCYLKANIIYFCICQFKILIIIKVGDKNNNTTGATSGSGTVTLSEHLSSTPVFNGVRVIRSLVLYVYFVDHCLSICTFYLLASLFFFDIRILLLWYLSIILDLQNFFN